MFKLAQKTSHTLYTLLVDGPLFGVITYSTFSDSSRHGESIAGNLTCQFAMAHTRVVDDKFKARQWDARFNVQADGSLDRILQGLKADWDAGRLRYILCGGVEIGTRAGQTDHGVKHVHVAAVFHNAVSCSSILKNWGVIRGNGYYLVPRNQDLPFSGWRAHHVKEYSKVDPGSLVLYEQGDLPPDNNERQKSAKSSELEKKRKVDEILVDIGNMLEEGTKDEEIFAKYPRNFLLYGERLKAMKRQKRDFFQSRGDPNIWLYGFAGTGKTAVLSFIYPDYYKKNLHNKFFDLMDPKVHTHVMLEDLDHEAVERLSLNFIKTICDEAGFAIDQKYKTPQLVRTTVLVTSNFSIADIMPDGLGIEENKAALLRRFWHVRVDEFMRVVGLKLVDKGVRWGLKKAGNTDMSKLFIPWDYKWDLPSCEPLKTPEEYQAIVKDAFYA